MPKGNCIKNLYGTGSTLPYMLLRGILNMASANGQEWNLENDSRSGLLSTYVQKHHKREFLHKLGWIALKGVVKVQTHQKLRSWNYRSVLIPHTSLYSIPSLFYPSTINVLLFSPAGIRKRCEFTYNATYMLAPERYDAWSIKLKKVKSFLTCDVKLRKLQD